MLDFDPRILGGALGGAVFVLVIAGAAVVRRARARRRDRILGRVRLVGEERRRDRLARTAERLAGDPLGVPRHYTPPPEGKSLGTVTVNALPAPARCTCGAKPEGVRSGDSVFRRYHIRECPAWTKEGAEAFAKLWRERGAAFDRSAEVPIVRTRLTAPPPREFDWPDEAKAPLNPTLSEDAAERFARIAHVVDPPPWDAAAPEPLTGGGGDFGGAGATASYDPPAADPEPSCDHSPSYDTSSSCDSGGGYSGGGDL